MTSHLTQVPTLLPLSALPRLLGVSIAAVYRAVNRGDIGLCALGGRKRVTTAEVERILGRSLTLADFARDLTPRVAA